MLALILAASIGQIGGELGGAGGGGVQSPTPGVYFLYTRNPTTGQLVFMGQTSLRPGIYNPIGAPPNPFTMMAAKSRRTSAIAGGIVAASFGDRGTGPKVGARPARVPDRGKK
jgi:hypothetical protein